MRYRKEQLRRVISVESSQYPDNISQYQTGNRRSSTVSLRLFLIGPIWTWLWFYIGMKVGGM